MSTSNFSTKKGVVQDDGIRTFKVLLQGDAASGKTAFLRRWRIGDFVKEYHPSPDVEVHPLVFRTSRGVFRFNVWDVAGKRGLGIDDYTGADACIVWFDLTQGWALRGVETRFTEVKCCDQWAPIVVCGNKYDLANKKISRHRIEESIRTYGFTYYDVSVKSQYNYDKPFLYLLRRLCGDDELTFGDVPPDTREHMDLVEEIRSSLVTAEGRFHLDRLAGDLPEETIRRYQKDCEVMGVDVLRRFPVETLRIVHEKYRKGPLPKAEEKKGACVVS